MERYCTSCFSTTTTESLQCDILFPTLYLRWLLRYFYVIFIPFIYLRRAQHEAYAIISQVMRSSCVNFSKKLYPPLVHKEVKKRKKKNHTHKTRHYRWHPIMHPHICICGLMDGLADTQTDGQVGEQVGGGTENSPWTLLTKFVSSAYMMTSLSLFIVPETWKVMI